MPVSFSGDPDVGPTTLQHDDESSVESEGSGSDQESRVSASDYAGVVSVNIPEWLRFTDEECRQQVKPYYGGDKVSIFCVCGNEAGNCGRSHTGHTRFGEGWYKIVLGHGGWFVEGVVGTCLSNAEYVANTLEEGKSRSKDVADAGAQLTVTSVTGLDHGQYLLAKGYASVVEENSGNPKEPALPSLPQCKGGGPVTPTFRGNQLGSRTPASGWSPRA
jgi:hypothetical protein